MMDFELFIFKIYNFNKIEIIHFYWNKKIIYSQVWNLLKCKLSSLIDNKNKYRNICFNKNNYKSQFLF